MQLELVTKVVEHLGFFVPVVLACGLLGSMCGYGMGLSLNDQEYRRLADINWGIMARYGVPFGLIGGVMGVGLGLLAF